MNSSYECMRRAREKSRAELLEMRRWDVAQMLKEVELGEGSHENLSAIANVIYEPCFGWTKDACEYLRDQLVYLIGGERDAQRGCTGGAGGCDHSHEQTPFVGYDVLGNERHEAVCGLRKLDLHSNSVTKNQMAIANALGVDFDRSDLFSDAMRRRLIHLLGGDNQYVLEYPRVIGEPDGITITNGEHEVRIVKDDIIADDVSVMDIVNDTINKALRGQSRTCPESEPCVSESDYGTSITSELRKFVETYFINNTTVTGDKLLTIADRIDEQYEVTQKQIADLERECESLQAMVERRNVKCRTYRCHIDQMKGGSKRWREKCAKLEEENKGLKAALSCLEVDFKQIRSLASQIIDHTHDKETAADE